MRTHRMIVTVAACLLLVVTGKGFGQDSGAAKEAWPSLRATFDLQPRMGVQVYTEKHNGEDFSLAQWNVGAIFSYRVKRILTAHHEDIDRENQYNLVLGAGYQFIQTEQNNGTKREHRIIVQATPKYLLPGDFLAQDRSRTEFRWTNGAAYNFRYRNKLSVQRPLKLNDFRFTPYASGELFWDRNHHSWNENQYAFGVQFPYKKLMMLDTYYLRQNCTTCSQDPIDVFGISLNFYFRRK